MTKAEAVFNKLAQNQPKVQKQVVSGTLKGSRIEKQRIEPTSSGGWKNTNVMSVQRPEGKRFYSGTGTSKGMQMAGDKAAMNARMKMMSSPADSITTQQFKDFKSR